MLRDFSEGRWVDIEVRDVLAVLLPVELPGEELELVGELLVLDRRLEAGLELALDVASEPDNFRDFIFSLGVFISISFPFCSADRGLLLPFIPGLILP